MEEEINELKGKRVPLKTLNIHKLDKNTNHHLFFKEKLRESCYKRVKEDRAKLLWKFRSPHQKSCAQQEFMKSAFKDIVSDELKKLKKQESNVPDVSKSLSGEDDMLWEYDGLHTADQEECEEILLEMQRIFYDDISLEENQREAEKFIVLDDEEDEYLASAIQEYMQLNDGKALKEQTWCPICKKGELQENIHFIYCNLCHFKLNRGDEVNMVLLRDRLAEANEEHLDRGCRCKPEFCVETIFDLTALYLRCQQCHTFEIVI
ncbi:hypothetical protein RND81_13G141400 [Saponaria officinalis]|uniref:RPA-interacting protein n=1 Tax=Saponaria officinalis TaxID=3572 RepID=A0AAW1GXL1_SAPOF